MFRSHTDCIRTFQDDSQSSSNQCNSIGYRCDMCPEDSVKFITETDVEIHRKSNHFREIVSVQEKERFCDICMKLQPNYTSLITHQKTEHLLSSPTAKRIEREIYICDYCNNVFFNRDLLEIHIEFRHLYDNVAKRRNRYFKCPKCLKTSSLLNVWFHFQQHDIPSVTACDICITTFSNRKQLLEHLKTHPMLYRCDTCLYTTYKESLFNSHLAKHESRVVTSKRKVEKTIKRVFRMAKKEPIVTFNIHNLLKGLKLPNTLYICTLCREICTDKIDMRTHVLRDHLFKETTVVRKYVCSCGLEFSNKILIKQHVFKLKGEHRVLEEGEIQEVLQKNLEDEQVQEISLQSNYDEIQPLYVIETLGDTYDSDNLILDKTTTDKLTENTDITITRLTDEQTDNNIIINTENLAESGVILITRVANTEIEVDNEIITTDNQIITTNGQIITTDSQIITTDSQIITTDC